MDVPPLLARALAGLALAAAAAVWARRREWVTAPAAALLALFGTVVATFGGLAWAGTAGLAFAATAALSASAAVRDGAEEDGAGGGGQTLRTAGQVAGSCGVAAAAALAYGLAGEPAALAWAFAGALATVAGDTWSSDLVPFYRTAPESLLDGGPVDPDTAGAVSLEGFLAVAIAGVAVGATLGGALSLGPALLGGAASGAEGAGSGWLLVPAAVFGGVVGSMADSALRAAGAGGGLRSEAVNFLSSAVGAAAAAGLGLLLLPR